jgi:MYXO-CTERM domain-containing protein
VDGVCCNAACNGSCEACTSAKKGQGADGACGNVKVDTDPDNDCTPAAPDTCQETGACDGTGGCKKYGSGTACGAATCTDTANASTLSGLQCDGLGVCKTNPAGSCSPYRCANANACANSCVTDAQCLPSFWCELTSCVDKKPNGAACLGDNECSSNFCVDGVCCQSACNGTCQACAGVYTGQSDGSCAPALDGLDPHDSCDDDGAQSCDLDGTCNGSGQCRVYAQGSPCNQTSCVQNVLTGYLCDGAGTCDPSANQDCTPYLCTSTGCTTTCTSSAACASTGFCDANSECQAKKNLGEACESGDQCSSTFCVDGYCCVGPCTGQCEACDVADAEGQCVPVSGAPHGRLRPPCDLAPADEPCAGAACDGVVRTSCEGLAGPEVSCREGSCDVATNIATFAAACNGKGTCPELQTEECEPFVCQGNQCGKKPCETDDDCAPSFRCALTAGEMDCIPQGASTCNLTTHTVKSPTGEEQNCAPYQCNVTGKCNETCVSSEDCSPGNFCNTQVSPGRCQAPQKPQAEEDAGCGCRVAGDERNGSRAWALLGVAALLVRRRKRRG